MLVRVLILLCSNVYLCSVESSKLKVIKQFMLNDRDLFGLDQEKTHKHFNY